MMVLNCVYLWVGRTLVKRRSKIAITIFFIESPSFSHNCSPYYTTKPRPFHHTVTQNPPPPPFSLSPSSYLHDLSSTCLLHQIKCVQFSNFSLLNIVFMHQDKAFGTKGFPPSGGWSARRGLVMARPSLLNQLEREKHVEEDARPFNR